MRSVWLLAIVRVIIGQLLSLLMSLTGVSTTKLVNNNASYPILQSLSTYAAIVCVYLPCYLIIRYKYRDRCAFSNFTFLSRWWKYIGLGLIDFEANYCVVLAYQYTNIMSVQLFNCLTVPCVMILSYFLLNVKFAVTHIFGSLLALCGLILLIILDADGLSRSDKGQKPILGDMLCVISSILYATSNVLTEWFIKPQKKTASEQQASMITTNVGNRTNTIIREHNQEGLEQGQPIEENIPTNEVHDVHQETRETNNSELLPSTSQMSNIVAQHGIESCVMNIHTSKECREVNATLELPNANSDYYAVPRLIPAIENLCCMSCSALLFSTVQFFAIEWKTFAPHRGDWNKEDWLFQIMFMLTMLCVYTLMPLLFLLTSAAFTNVSLLTANIFAIIWNVTIFYIYPTRLFFISFVLTACGIIIYDISDVVHIPFFSRINYLCGEIEH